MKREDIETLPNVRPYCFETQREETWYNVGLMDGLEAADNEPRTDELWHNPYEKPQEGRTIMVYLNSDDAVIVKSITEDGMFYLHEHWYYLIKQRCWAYIDDLLPQHKC